jgi:hypothetical protein
MPRRRTSFASEYRAPFTASREMGDDGQARDVRCADAMLRCVDVFEAAHSGRATP